MFPSHYPIPILLHMLGVIIAVLTTLVLTGNPLALFGFYLMPSLPLITPEEDLEEEEESMMGFHANIK